MVAQKMERAGPRGSSTGLCAEGRTALLEKQERNGQKQKEVPKRAAVLLGSSVCWLLGTSGRKRRRELHGQGWDCCTGAPATEISISSHLLTAPLGRLMRRNGRKEEKLQQQRNAWQCKSGAEQPCERIPPAGRGTRSSVPKRGDPRAQLCKTTFLSKENQNNKIRKEFGPLFCQPACVKREI